MAPEQRLFKDQQTLPILAAAPGLVIIDKPAGLAVHPGPATPDSVEARLRPHPRGGPWIAHRLDRDTSGCLLIATRKTALIAAQRAFAERRVRKTYWAIVQGEPRDASGAITAPLLKRNTRTGWTIIADPDGEEAETAYVARATQHGLTLLELTLKTGRTHQARVHCAHIGLPIIGDSRYGSPHPHGLHLLARTLEIPRDTRPPLTATAPPPDRMTLFGSFIK